MAAATSYVLVNSGTVVGLGYSPDGTLPSGAIACTESAALAAGPWSTIVGGATLVVGTPPGPTVQQQAGTLMLATGLAITSTGTPALSATYPADPATMGSLKIIMAVIQATGSFPNPGIGGPPSTWPLRDMAGAWHTPTVAQFTAIFEALANFFSLCNLCVLGHPLSVLPSTTATIA